MAPKIEFVKPISSSKLFVIFSNGEKKTYDCEPLLSRPQFQLLKIPAFFKAVKVDPGGYGISWNDKMDLSEYELWTNGKPIINNTMPSDAPASKR